MSRIVFVVHPKHFLFMPMEWEAWDLHINGIEEVQFLKLMNVTPELRKVSPSNQSAERMTNGKVTASYIIDGAGFGKFPPISAVRPFLDEIKSWGFKIVHCSCPAPDEFSIIVLEMFEDLS